MKKLPEKTNVMRQLDAANIEYIPHYYGDTDAVSGTDVAAVLGQSPDRLFKTLVTAGASGNNYVFVIPASCELNLKKAAKAAGEKSVEMIKSKELLPLTGYIHGGCSPFGMKKLFPTFLDETAQLYDTVFVSAGKIGFQVEISPEDIISAVPAVYRDIT